MDFYGHASEERFLKLFGRPFAECLCGLSLKAGVLIIAVVDIIFMATSGLSILFFVIEIFLSSLSRWLIFSFFVDLYNIGIGISAIIGIRGINLLKVTWIHQYTVVKTLTVLGSLLFATLHFFIDPRDEFNSKTSQILFVVISSVIAVVQLICAKIVWSADVRIQNNEAVLVLHGLQVVRLMQQQTNNLAFAQPINKVDD